MILEFCCAVGSFLVLFSPACNGGSTKVRVGGRPWQCAESARVRASKRLYREKDPPGSGDGEENLSPKRLASSNRTASMVAEAVSHPARCEPLTRAARCTAGHAEPREEAQQERPIVCTGGSSARTPESGGLHEPSGDPRRPRVVAYRIHCTTPTTGASMESTEVVERHEDAHKIGTRPGHT